jgi:hypothetical protein
MNLFDTEAQAGVAGKFGSATMVRRSTETRGGRHGHLTDALVHADLLARGLLLRHGPELALGEGEDPTLLLLGGNRGLDERELLARADELELDLLEDLGTRRARRPSHSYRSAQGRTL